MDDKPKENIKTLYNYLVYDGFRGFIYSVRNHIVLHVVLRSIKSHRITPIYTNMFLNPLFYDKLHHVKPFYTK